MVKQGKEEEAKKLKAQQDEKDFEDKVKSIIGDSAKDNKNSPEAA